MGWLAEAGEGLEEWAEWEEAPEEEEVEEEVPSSSRGDPLIAPFIASTSLSSLRDPANTVAKAFESIAPAGNVGAIPSTSFADKGDDGDSDSGDGDGGTAEETRATVNGCHSNFPSCGMQR